MKGNVMRRIDDSVFNVNKSPFIRSSTNLLYLYLYLYLYTHIICIYIPLISLSIPKIEKKKAQIFSPPAAGETPDPG